MKTSARVQGIALSVTLALDARAKAMAVGGRDVVNMAVGEPDFPAPPEVRRAAVAKVESGDVRYTAAAGTPALRAALAAHLGATRTGTWTPAEVVVCHSAKHALSGACLALFEAGDEVLVPLPAWVSYEEILRIAGATPVCVPARADLGPDLDAITAALTPRTRGILLNSPCNPTGYIWTADELAAVMDVAERADLWVLTDEIYRRLVYDERPFVSPLEVHARARERCIVIDGASKAFAMTGYRIGFAAGPRDAIEAIARLHSQLTGSPNAVSQAAYLAALATEPPQVEEMRANYARRRELLIRGLMHLGLPTPGAHGAFYAFPDVAAHLGGATDSNAFCERLLDEEGVVLVPGSAFGAPTHVRLSYALGEAQLREALVRLGRFLGMAAG